MKQYKYPSVLSIAGFDGSGGAGIQADIKTISALGGYATTVLTALPVQNTQGVKNIHPIPASVVEEQIAAILDDIFPDAIKIGMVHTSELAETIAQALSGYKKVPVVFDPVMVSTSGHHLIKDKTIDTIVEKLFPIADIITPNMDEAAILAGIQVKTSEDMRTAGNIIKKSGCRNILLKGGHQEKSVITSLLLDEAGQYHSFETVKFKTGNTHGSGCTLSSAIATFMSRGQNIYDAVDNAQKYVLNAIDAGRDVQTGKGSGPLNHFFDPQKLIKNEIV